MIASGVPSAIPPNPKVFFIENHGEAGIATYPTWIQRNADNQPPQLASPKLVTAVAKVARK